MEMFLYAMYAKKHRIAIVFDEEEEEGGSEVRSMKPYSLFIYRLTKIHPVVVSKGIREILKNYKEAKKRAVAVNIAWSIVKDAVERCVEVNNALADLSLYARGSRHEPSVGARAVVHVLAEE